MTKEFAAIGIFCLFATNIGLLSQGINNKGRTQISPNGSTREIVGGQCGRKVFDEIDNEDPIVKD